MAGKASPRRAYGWARNQVRRRSWERMAKFSRPLDDAPPARGRFAGLYFAHQGSECHKWTQYFDAYDRSFDRFVGEPVRFLEIGVSVGGSLELWREYFGPDATIFGVDIDKRSAEVAGPHAEVRIGSQADVGFLISVVEEMGGVDVVLDDGSHEAAHQRASLDTLWPLLTDGGVYAIEDTHSAYWLGWGGGWRRPGQIVEVAKGLVDGMHRWYHGWPTRRSWAQTEVASVTFYDSFIAIEKRLHGPPQVLKVGTPDFE